MDRMLSGLSRSLGELYEADVASAYALVTDAERTLQALAELDEALQPSVELLSGIEIELREVATGLSRYRDRLETDPQRLEWVEARLGKIRELARRHNVEEVELEVLLTTLAGRVEQLQGANESLETLEAELESAADAYFEAAGRLTGARMHGADALAREVSAQLRELGLPHGAFRVHLERKPNDRADINGLDRIEFQVTLNPGQPFGPLSRMASGGELSRISLALEVVGRGSSSAPTMVFDEVDAGIGGGVAEIVGRRLGEIAAERQVLCVTHLPQVASQGQHHYRVVKLTDGQSSRTNVRPLKGEERVEELSRMLGGVEITERTRAHAAEMMGYLSRERT
jgi:DNA repair protein RecN (Recombination protein N)